MNEEEILSVLQSIEHALKIQYEENPELTDVQCIFSIENAKIAFKQEFGFAKNEKITDVSYAQSVIEACVSVGKARIESGLESKEFLSCLEKVRKSVKKHSRYGSRGYYEFVRNYV